MIDLEHQIREYYEHIVVSVTMDEIGITTDKIDTTDPVPTPRRYTRPVVVGGDSHGSVVVDRGTVVADW